MKKPKSSKWIGLALTPLVLALSGAAFAQTTLTAAVDLAVKKSPDVAIDAHRRLSVDEALRGARGGYLPRVDVGLGIGKEKASNATSRRSTPPTHEDYWTRREASVTASQMIFDSLATYNEVKRNEARVESSAHRVAGTAEQIALKAVESYLDVLRLRETVRLTKDNLASHEKTYDQIKLRADSGVGRKADQDQSQARLALAKANLVSAEANLRDAEINYARYTGTAPDNLVKPEGPKLDLMPKNAMDAFDKAKSANPLLKQAEADIKAANAQHNAAKSALGPRVDLELGASDLDNASGVPGHTDDRYAMLRMRWNIFRGGADVARIAETKALSYEATEIRNRTIRQLDQSVNLSWNAYSSVNSRLPNLKQHAESSLMTRDAYVQQFSIGQRTLIDLLDTENEYYTSSVEYNNAQYLELFARYRLMADMGRLLESLNVQQRDESLLAGALPLPKPEEAAPRPAPAPAAAAEPKREENASTQAPAPVTVPVSEPRTETVSPQTPAPAASPAEEPKREEGATTKQ